MRLNRHEADVRVKRKIVSGRKFALTYVIMLLLVGIQMGIIIAPVFTRYHPVIHVCVIMLYWVIVASAFLYVTNWQIKKSYDAPMRRLSEAAKRVAEGDFSVYVEPQHTPEKYDYIDVMCTDFNLMVQELGSIETLKNDFVANVSHEIKTPLAVIKNYTTMLRAPELEDDVRHDYQEAILRAADNLSALVTNILRLNKLENQEIEAPSEPYDLCRQLCDCLLGFERLLEEKQLILTTDIESRAIIPVDKDALEIVWNNLISNALKFTPHGGTITVVQTSDADSFSVSVTDTGCGMDRDTARRVFDKFYQGDTSHSGEGNGLGLALAHRIVERIGGSITIESALGHGSTFTVTIPVAH